MTEQEALLQTILAYPEQDTPRLVYADWLEEHDQVERAEFIRYQIEMATLPKYEDRYLQCQERTKTLEAAHPEWKLKLTHYNLQRFGRGFVEALEVDAVTLLPTLQESVPQTPLQEIFFRNELIWSAEELDQLRQNGSMPQLRGLGFHSCRSQMILQILRYFRPPDLRSLMLYRCPVYHPYLGHFLEELEPVHLQKLLLRLHPLSPEGAALLSALPQLVGLRELDLQANADLEYTARIRAPGAISLAESPYLTQLRSLNLAHQSIGDAGFRALARSPNMQHVETLDVSYNDIGVIGSVPWEELAASRYLDHVKSLNLAGNVLHDMGLQELLKWSALPQLRTLDLSHCQLTERGIKLLVEATVYHPQLRLTLRGYSLPAYVARHLRSSFGNRLNIEPLPVPS